jgi:secondary thiamine-phosphate synthase enzyme
MTGVDSYSFQVMTRGETDIVDITGEVRKAFSRSAMHTGTVTVFVSGSTAGITTVEYESGLVQDLKDAYERMAPRNGNYQHNLQWGDGNGYAHVRASLTGQHVTVPFMRRTLALGRWQQIILIDFDNRPRNREITVLVTGEQQ